MRRNPASRREGCFGSDRVHQLRTQIAQTAAKLIVEHGLHDWAHAKRKAARQLGVDEQRNLPSSEELEQALREYNNLYRPESHAELLRVRRSLALEWMRRLMQYSPRLAGGVATGLATNYSDVRIEIVADDSKTVEMFLLSGKIEFESAPMGRNNEVASYLLRADDATLRLVVTLPAQRRNLSRERLEEQLDIAALEHLLARG